MWMNESEIDDAVRRMATAPLRLARAAEYLQCFKDIINEISDGWAYWSYGTKCSDGLQAIVREGQYPANQYAHSAASQADVDKACRKIAAFLRRCRQTKDHPAVLAWLHDHACEADNESTKRKGKPEMGKKGLSTRDIERKARDVELAIVELSGELDEAGLAAVLTVNICKTRTVMVEPSDGTLSFWIGHESEDL